MNEYLSDSVFASGNKLTLVDIVLYVTVHSAVVCYVLNKKNISLNIEIYREIFQLHN